MAFGRLLDGSIGFATVSPDGRTIVTASRPVSVSVPADNERFSTDVGVRNTRGDGALIASGDTVAGSSGPETRVVAAYLLVTGLLARCLFYKVADIDTSIQEQPYSNTDDRAGL